MKRKIAFGILFIITTLAASASIPQPEYMPYCTTPQQVAPMQMNGYNSNAMPLVWNGKDYAGVWIEVNDIGDNFLCFRRFFADGTPASDIVHVISYGGAFSSPPSIVWNGSGYGIAYGFYNNLYRSTYFCRIDANGTVLGSLLKISSHELAAFDNFEPPVAAWSGSGYAVAWVDGSSGHSQVYATLLDADENITHQDIHVSETTFSQTGPSMAWIAASSVYQLAWSDTRSGTRNEIYGAQLVPDSTVYNNNLLVSGSSTSNMPSLAASPNGCGLSWIDYRDGQMEIYFALLNYYGSKWTADTRLTENTTEKYSPDCVWTGIEYGVFWYNKVVGNIYSIRFQRVSGMGVPQGSAVQVTEVGSMAMPKGAFAHYGYLFSCVGDGNYVEPLGCASPYPPGCPSNLLAYGVSGTTATIAWQAALDNYTDIAYYAVYRNNAEIAKTSNTYYTDTGLGLNTTYNYTVRAVNAAQYMNDPLTCGTGQAQSVYVKTNASFTLMLDKSADPDAHLYWNDGGMNSYNIYRGTSPQVMSLIGTTSSQSADDNNVLLDTNTYFYTVDDPGQ